MASCSICCDNFNRSTRKPVECNYCDLPQCTSCVKTFLLGSSSDPHCMGCKKAWNREFLDGCLTKVFIENAYKKHRENLLFDREKALMPETLPYAEKEKMCRELTEEVNKLYVDIAKISQEIAAYPLPSSTYTVNKMIGHLKIHKELKLQRAELVAEKELKNDLLSVLYRKKSVSKKQFVRACPANDCRGFLSSQWKCGMCDVWVCPDCHEIIGKDKQVEHVCDPNNVATAKLLDNDTRPCPKCASMIFKIHGCFAKDTPVLTWDGNVKMSQHIEVGDELIGDDGKKRVVQELVSGVDDLYEVTQLNGIRYVVNSKHKLALKFKRDKTIFWKGSENAWCMLWFDHDAKIMKSKTSKVTDTVSPNQARLSLEDFKKTIMFPDVIEISVDDYNNLTPRCKTKLVGFKSDGVCSDWLRTAITVSPVGTGHYYGWSIDQNKRFLLEDFTVVRNCDQMYCTQCHTPFSWKTGQVETGRIHNPHYYEYQRQINNGQAPREIGDVRCGGMPDIRVVIETTKRIYGKKTFTLLELICRLHAHIEIVEMPRFVVNAVQDNRRLRIQYILKDIDENEFKRILQHNEKNNCKKTEISMVLQMFLDTSMDIMRLFVTNAKTPDDVENSFTEMLALRAYTQGCLDKIGKRYKCVPKKITEEWTFE